MSGRKNTIVLLMMVQILFAVLLVIAIPTNLDSDMRMNYIAIYGLYILNSAIVFAIFNKTQIYMFEPAFMVLLLNYLTYAVWPMLSIINDDTTIVGFEVFDYCVDGCIVYLLSLIAFIAGYYTSNGKKRIESNKMPRYNGEVIITSIRKERTIRIVCYALCIFGLTCFVLDMLTHGYTIRYIFTFGMSGFKVEEGETSGILLSLAAFMYPAFLYLDVYDTNKLRVNLLRVIVAIPMLVRGTRLPLILLILSTIAFYYVRDHKSPKMKNVIITVLALVVLIAGMQYFRGNMRMGYGIAVRENQEFNLQYIYDVFSGNFDMYKTLYAYIQYFPQNNSFLLGNNIILRTIIHVIPRAVWPGKENLVVHLNSSPLGPRSGAWTISQLAELYGDFSWVGCILGMYIFGKLCLHLKKRYLYGAKSYHDFVIYSVLFAYLWQLILRGSTYTNFWSMVFMLIPVGIIRLIERIEMR